MKSCIDDGKKLPLTTAKACVAPVHRSNSFVPVMLAFTGRERMLSGHKWLAARLLRVALPSWGMQVRVGRFLSCALVGLALSLLVSPAGADELRQLYAQILRDPTNSELNFRYAQLAEQRGEIRKALSAYERILLNDPDNPDVRRALQRIRRALQPDTTQFFAELGAAY